MQSTKLRHSHEVPRIDRHCQTHTYPLDRPCSTIRTLISHGGTFLTGSISCFLYLHETDGRRLVHRRFRPFCLSWFAYENVNKTNRGHDQDNEWHCFTTSRTEIGIHTYRFRYKYRYTRILPQSSVGMECPNRREGG